MSLLVNSNSVNMRLKLWLPLCVQNGGDLWHIHKSSFRIHNWGIEQNHSRDLEQQKQDVKSNCILETRESEVQPIITHSLMRW